MHASRSHRRGVLLAVAVAILLNVVLIPAGAQPYFVPLILIVVGLYLLVERRGRSPEN